MRTDLGMLPADPAFDVVVIGAGGAGMAAALFAALRGLSALVVERSAFVGGTTALSAGTTWVPNTAHAEGTGDSLETAAHFLDQAVGNASAAGLRRAFLEAGPAAIAALEAGTEVRFRAYARHPDYTQEAEGASVRGRALEPLPFDGRRLGAAFALLRPPIPEFTVLGGMMVDRTDIGHLLNMGRSPASAWHAARLLARHARDRMSHPRGTRLVMGNALAGRLLASLVGQSVPIVTRTDAVALHRDAGGAVRGVTLRQGAVERRVAARAVILASGGFNRHPQRRAEWLHAPVPSLSPVAPGITGAAHDLALAIGAAYGPPARDAAFWAPVSIRRRADGSDAVFPHFVLDRSKPGTFCVDRRGRRFVNESTSYHEFARAMFAAHRKTPTIPCFLICDAAALRRYGLGMVRPGGRGLAAFIADGYLAHAADIAGLAGMLGIDPDGLEETVRRMNTCAQTGIDPEFGRGTTEYHRINGDPSHLPNPTLGPVATPPFYAVRLYPADIGAARGFAGDEDARVLDAAGAPIPGLYAVGNDLHSVMGGAYPAPGITLGPGLVFAWRAVERIAGWPPGVNQP